MIVDDSPYNLFVMEEMLKKHTIINRIVKKMNGKEALKEIIEGSTHF